MTTTTTTRKFKKPNLAALFTKIAKQGGEQNQQMFIEDHKLSRGYRRVFSATGEHYGDITIISVDYRIGNPTFTTVGEDETWFVDPSFIKGIFDCTTLKLGDAKEGLGHSSEIKTNGLTAIPRTGTRGCIVDDFIEDVRRLRFFKMNPDWNFLVKACDLSDSNCRTWTRGVVFTDIDKKPHIATSDGRRAHWQPVKTSAEFKGVIIPGELIRMIKDLDVEMAIWNYGNDDRVQDKRIVVRLNKVDPDLYLIVQPLDTTFPEMDRVIPNAGDDIYDVIGEIESEEIRTRLENKRGKRNPLLSSKYGGGTREGVRFEGNEMKIAIDIGPGQIGDDGITFTTTLPHPVTNGQPILLHGKYLLDTIDQGPGIVKFRGQLKAATYHSHQGDLNAVIMPVRLQE